MENYLSLLSTPIQYIKGVGPYLSQLFEKLGIKTIEELLYHIPTRYLDRRTLFKIKEACSGTEAVFMVELVMFGEVAITRGRRKIFQAVFKDDSGFISAKWFNYYQSQIKGFKKGSKAYLTGKVEIYHGEKQIVHPEVEWIEEDSEKESSDSGTKIIPIYPSTEGLRQKTFYKAIENGLEKISKESFETLPLEIQKKYQLIGYQEALLHLHHPPLESEIETFNNHQSKAHQRLIFDEFFFLELSLALQRENILREKGIKIELNSSLLELFYKTISFELTNAQKKVIGEILDDLQRDAPMHRLLQGDVGSGKTIIAIVIALLVVKAGYQVCLMAPTEILAEQHFRNLNRLLIPFEVEITLLKSDLTSSEKKERLQKVSQGRVQLVVGTHSLIQEEVKFASLALAIVDEQHRFGVLQRGEIKKKGNNPHLLIMTATPIPRTLALTVYGDLDLSILDEMPKGRIEIVTKLFSDKELAKIYPFIRQEILKGRQAYFIYPLIEESEALDLKNATQMFKKLRDEIFPDLKVGLLHGKMKGEEKDKIINSFLGGKIQILVSTTVIEVGIDVPNATIMVIEHAERFGLSQLHQIRGRVGRGAEKSYCFLIAGWPRSDIAKERLKAMCQTTDGFKIAEVDLNLRGPGDFLGTRQSGLPDFRIANLIRDLSILEKARKEAFEWLKKDPKLEKPESQIIKAILKHRWKGRLNLAQIG